MENQGINWKHAVTTFSEKVFPGLSDKITKHITENQVEVMSNLPLQMALYFNVILVPIWVIVIILYFFDEFTCFNELYKYLSVTIILSIFILEILRLYLGYEGNLRDKVPELAGFWMLSVLLQFPLETFLLLNPYFKLRILETTIQSIMYCLLGAQLFVAYFALRYTAKKQAFHMRIMNLNTNVSATFKQNKYKLN